MLSASGLRARRGPPHSQFSSYPLHTDFIASSHDASLYPTTTTYMLSQGMSYPEAGSVAPQESFAVPRHIGRSKSRWCHVDDEHARTAVKVSYERGA